ncbi:MAG: sugar phosphate isomerase/epimerase [Ruminococcaceae bacterium]|nr:sugar phosphate isomerase/epimerase [Oscillospiraceae bacterium]
MKYGMPTLVECNGIIECAEVAKQNGLDFIEVNMSFPQYIPQNSDIELYKKLSREHGIFYTIHADEQLNPFDFNPEVSKCYFKVMADSIDFAKAIGAPVINMHLLKGVYVTLPEKVVLLTDVYKDVYIERVKAFISMCEEKIGDADLKIAIENVDANPFTESQTDALEYFMNSSVFGLTLDVGHDDCMSGKDRHVFEKYPEKLIHMHLHDSDGKHPHLPLGEGRLNIGEKIKMLTKGSTCLIEVKTIAGLNESTKYINDRGYKI